MSFKSKLLFIVAQAYLALSSILFLTGYVLKDPMQNAFYLMYALTLPFVSVFIFVFFNYKAIKSRDVLFVEFFGACHSVFFSDGGLRRRWVSCNVLSRKDKPRISVFNLAEEHREFGAGLMQSNR
jgi:hypothetical protein